SAILPDFAAHFLPFLMMKDAKTGGKNMSLPDHLLKSLIYIGLFQHLNGQKYSFPMMRKNGNWKFNMTSSSAISWGSDMRMPWTPLIKANLLASIKRFPLIMTFS